MVDTASCTGYGRTVEAPSGLPWQGNIGRCLAGLVAELRAALVPLDRIATAVSSIAGVLIAAVTMSNVMASVGDACGQETCIVWDV